MELRELYKETDNMPRECNIDWDNRIKMINI
jgi:hypothetical protein